MATIKDIAKAAHVSQGTVSNVLNNRGNVSSEKIRRVLSVCDALGYIPNHQAKYLRSSQARLLGIMLPNLSDRRHIDFFLSFKAYADSHGYTVLQYLPSRSDDSKSEEAIRQEMLRDGVSGIAVVGGAGHSSNPSFSDGLNVLYVEHRPSFSAPYIGFDYFEAGHSIAESLLRHRHSKIVIITGGLWATNNFDFCRGLHDVLDQSPVQIKHIQTDKQTEYASVLKTPELYSSDAIVCSNFELALITRNILSSFSSASLPKIFTLSTLFTMPEASFIKYELNYRLLGNTAAQNLIARIEGRDASDEVILDNDGFRSWTPPALSLPSEHPINVVTLDSPGAYNMRDIARLYTKQTGIPVNITIYSYDEMYEIFNNMREKAVFDVIRMDMTWLSFFARKILKPLTEIDPSVTEDLAEFLGGMEPYSYVGDVLYALPSSPSTQMLFYRNDLFSNAMYRRMFHEQYGVELSVPSTFDEYNRVAAFFTRSLNPDSPVEFGSTLTLGSTAVACSEYLARLFALQENLYGKDGYVNLREANYVDALKQLLDVRPYSDPNYCTWWRNTADAFASGNTAMAILYDNYASPLVGHRSKVRDCIGYSMIPGGRPLIGGGCMGVSRFTDQPEHALRFIRWYCSEPVSSANTFLGSVSPCKKSYDNYEIINMYPWLKFVRNSFDAARGRRMPPTVDLAFDERRFMSIIGMAVKNAYSNALQPQQAMDYAQTLFAEQFPKLCK